MPVPCFPYVLVGMAVGLGSALWLTDIALPIGLGAISSGAATIIQTVVIAATALVAGLAAAAGALVAADRQADVQNRQAWAQFGLTAAELSARVDPRAAWDIDSRYPPSAHNDALWQVLRAHRFAALKSSVGYRILAAAPTEFASARAALGQGRDGGELSQARTCGRAVRRLASGNLPAAQTGAPSGAIKLRTERSASRPRLVVNANAWTGRLADDACVPSSSHSADIITLGNRRDNRAQPPPDASVTSTGAALPNCRGPPQVVLRRSRVSALLSPKRQADPVVRDNLGAHIPVCTAELDVIDTYLGHVLQDLLASSTGEPGAEKT